MLQQASKHTSKHVFPWTHGTFFIPLSLWIGCSCTFLRFHPPTCTMMVWLTKCNAFFKSYHLNDVFLTHLLFLRSTVLPPQLHWCCPLWSPRRSHTCQGVSVICWERPHRNVLPLRLRNLLGKEVKLCPFPRFRQVWWYLHSQWGGLAQGLAKEVKEPLGGLDLSPGQTHIGLIPMNLNPAGLQVLLH